MRTSDVIWPTVVETAACLSCLLALGLVERLARDRAWRDVPIRIHVNGTRGKSTVTRLIWSALRQAGIPAVAKTTGTAARLLLPDGTERPLMRRAPASIREQLALLRTARHAGARAVVAECMALEPELQWTSEHQMIRATLGVITNVRVDHTDVMGSTLSQIASTLANTVPSGGVLVLGEDTFLSLFETQTARLGSRLVRATQAVPAKVPAGTDLPAWLAENERTAIAVTRELGIPDETALAGFRLAPADPGAAREGRLVLAGASLAWIDATAANDPDSFDRLTPQRAVLVYNHRHDRGVRLSCFAERSAAWASADHVLITGDRPAALQWPTLHRRRAGRPVEFVGKQALRQRLVAIAGHSVVAARSACLVFCGNTKGLNVARVLAEAGAHD
jgi:poly-gamma-glutamate synthase PgsB/CapB